MQKAIKILLVEDEHLIAMCQRMELTRAGYNVIKCLSSGEEAVEFSRQSSPDLIIMDVRLAGEMDGVAAAEKILAFTSVPIIFVTGYANPEIRNRAYQLKYTDYLVKPVMISDLKAIIDSHFKNQHD